MALFCPLWFCIHRNSAAPVMGSSDTWIDICLLWLPLPVMASLACYGLRDFASYAVPVMGKSQFFVLGYPPSLSFFVIRVLGPVWIEFAQRLSCRFLGEF